MDLKHQITNSLHKIIRDCLPDQLKTHRYHSPIDTLASSQIKLQSINLKKRVSDPLMNHSRREIQRLLNPRKLSGGHALKRYDYHHVPSNASKSRMQQIEGRKNRKKQKRETSYYLVVKQREKEDEARRIEILKQVIKENVKRKNEQMRICSRRRFKTLV